MTNLAGLMGEAAKAMKGEERSKRKASIAPTHYIVLFDVGKTEPVEPKDFY